MLRSVFREADAGLHRVRAVEVTCTTGEEESVVCGHVTGAGTAEVDGVIEDDILAAADLAVASISIYFNYLICFCKDRCVIITNEVSLVCTRVDNL
jgi:hypothetical protein